MATLGGVQDIKGIANIIEIENLARFAVDDHNKKENSELEFKKVLSAKQQVVAGTIYYITMEVKDGDQLKVYEARVWEKPWLNFREVQEFKLIGDVPSDSKFDGEKTPSDSKIDDGKTPSGSTT